jgi:hypothetical protein
LLEAFFREEIRRMQRETRILRDKLALPCNDTDREATRTAYKLFQADIAEVSASIRDPETREMEEREREHAAVREMEERKRAAVREMEEREREQRKRVEKMAGSWTS